MLTKRHWIGIGAAAATTVTVIVVLRPANSPPLNARAEVRYVGAAICADCHAEIVRSYEQTDHSRSLQAAHPEALAGGRLGKRVAEVQLPQRSYVYRLQERGERLIFQAGPSYVDSAAHEREVAYLLGSGKRGQGLLAEIRSGESTNLAQLPITFYQDQHAWGLSPGQADHANQAPLKFRRVTEECLRCHVTRLPTANQAEGVSCESCHGPGGLHVDRWRGQARQVTECREDATIVNPGRLPVDRAAETCAPCHGGELEPKPGRSFAFRPGLRLADFFDKRLGKPGEQHSEMESLRASRCFTESRGRLSCGSCHEPHQPTTDVLAYDRACVNCHQPQTCPRAAVREPKLKAAGCVSCHMPEKAPWSHASFRDHRIQRSPARTRSVEPSAGTLAGLQPVRRH